MQNCNLGSLFPMDLERAATVFVTAVSQLKSASYGFSASRADGLWVMKDDPPRQKARTSEVVAIEDDPPRVVQSVERLDVGWHFLSHLIGPEKDDRPVLDAYKRLGYRAQSTEWMFVHDLVSIRRFDSSPSVRLIGTQEELDRVPQQASQKRKLRPGTRLFCISDDARDYGWVRSVPVGGDTWAADLFVHADFRGRGYGRALMSALLRTDQEQSVQSNVLLASSSGARLYPHLGYRRIGVLRMFCPRDRSAFRK